MSGQDELAAAATFLSSLRRKLLDGRIPASGGIDLTRRCNLKCHHCYHGAGEARRGEDELSTEEWLSILDQIAAAGCLQLFITGGDPLVRRDFAEIYSRAKSLGMLVTVFTNGTLISPETLALFRDLPPHVVEISLYGASEATCERVTGVAGSFRRSVEGIDALIDAGVNVGLKTVLLAENRHELEAIRGMARERGAKFRLDALIFPRLDGDRAPLDQRVPPREAVALESADREKWERMARYFDSVREAPPASALYSCGAGRTAFHVSASGKLLPCLLMEKPTWDLRRGSFLEGWEAVIVTVRDERAGEGYRCGECEKRFLCGLCPAFAELEQGAPDRISPYVCAIGEERYRVLAGEEKASSGKK